MKLGNKRITFYSSDLANAPDPSFMAQSQWTSSPAHEVAGRVLAWATAAGYAFRSGAGSKFPTLYVVIPPPGAGGSREGAPFLALYQGRPHPPRDELGSIHFNFARLTELGFTDRASEPALLAGLNAALPKDWAVPLDCLTPSRDGRYWGAIPYRALASTAALAAFTKFATDFAAGLRW